MKKYQLVSAIEVAGVSRLGIASIASLAFLLVPIPAASDEGRAAEKIFRHDVVAVHPHDVTAFTQGLAYVDGTLVEGTGGHGRSEIALRNIGAGAPRARVRLPAKHFGEGVTIARDRIFQLTWQSGIAYVYDLALRPAGSFRYAGEGWGLAFDGRHLVMSDGSARLQFREPSTFEQVRSVTVTSGGAPVPRLNELEYARGRVFANVWRTTRIAVIEPATGTVAGWLELRDLLDRFPKPPGWDPEEHVLNGIAFDSARDVFFVTGKCWPVLFELKVADAPQPASGTALPQ